MTETVTRTVLREMLEQQSSDLKSALQEMLKTTQLQLKDGLRQDRAKTLANLPEFRHGRAKTQPNLQEGLSGFRRVPTLHPATSSKFASNSAESTMVALSVSDIWLPSNLGLSRAFLGVTKKAAIAKQTASNTAASATQAVSHKAVAATQRVGSAVKQGALKSINLLTGALSGSQAGSDQATPAEAEESVRMVDRSATNSYVPLGERPAVDSNQAGAEPMNVRTHTCHSQSSQLRNLAVEESSEDSDVEPSGLLKFVNAKGFDLTVSSAITLNALFVGVETDYMARHWSKQLPLAFLIFDVMSCVFFAAEMALRLLAFGRSFFTSRHRYKNLFDLGCVATQLGDVGLMLSHGNIHSCATVSQNLRLLRFFRIAHIFQNIPELRHLLSAIAHSLKSLLWTLVVLLLVVYFVAIVVTQLVTAAKTSDLSNRGESLEDPKIDEFFGTLPRSVISLYAAVSDGLEWQDVTIPLRKYLESSMIDVVFALYMAFMLYAMLNIVTGHIVEAAIAVAQEEKRKKLGKSLRSMLDKVSKHVTGEIHLEDLNEFLLHDTATRRFLKEIDLDPYEAISVFLYLDRDHTNMVDTEDLVQGCIRFRGAAKVSHVLAFMDEFHEHAAYVERMLETLEFLLTGHTLSAYGSEGTDQGSIGKRLSSASGSEGSDQGSVGKGVSCVGSDSNRNLVEL